MSAPDATTGPRLVGLHHVTAVTGDAQRNIGFYTGILGLRLLKQTVSFDEPTSHHLYYGVGVGAPGTIMTFFAWPGAQRGQQGAGQVALTALTIPLAGLAYWIERCIRYGIAYSGPVARGAAKVLSLRDPDGLALELVATPEAPAAETAPGGPVPAEYAVRGLHSVAVWLDKVAPSIELITEVLGFRPVAQLDDTTTRFAAGAGRPGALLDVRSTPGFWAGTVGLGSVHHVAWHAPGADELAAWRGLLIARGYDVTPIRDRNYFQSIYFTTPGEIVFEIATTAPGFTVDEPADQLGSALMLPPWLEPERARLTAALPPLSVPPATGSTRHFAGEPDNAQ